MLNNELHDSVMNMVVSHASLVFNCPIYKVDDYVRNLREICKDDTDYYIWFSTIENNPIYKEFRRRFFGLEEIYTMDKTFVKKIGDVIIARGVCNLWDLFEIKTSERSTHVFNVNAESFLQFMKFPMNQWMNTHFTFYSSVDMSMKAVRLDRFQEIQGRVPICHYKGVDGKVVGDAAYHIPFQTTIEYKGESDPDRNIDNENNIYYKFDLNSFPPGAVLDIREYFQQLKVGMLYQQPVFPVSTILNK